MESRNSYGSNYFCRMQETFSFLPAAEGDAEALDVLVNRAYRGDASRAGWTTEADLLDGIRTDADGLRQMIRSPQSVILTCRDGDGRLCGCVYLQQQDKKLYLGMLTVDPQLQNKGIGKRLLQAAEEHAHRLGLHSIIMTVITVRETLIAWYERHGYRQTGEKRPFPDDPRFGIPKQPLEFIVMEKTLPAAK